VDVPAPKIAVSIVDVPSKTTEKLERLLGENDVAEIITAEDLCMDFKIAASNCKVSSEGEESTMTIDYLGKASYSDYKELKNADTIVSKSHIQFGSLFIFVQHEDMMKGKSMTVAKMEKTVEVISKPRTALFKKERMMSP
jgi:hypothetical protein